MTVLCELSLIANFMSFPNDFTANIISQWEKKAQNKEEVER